MKVLMAVSSPLVENLAVPFLTDFDNRTPKTLVLTEPILVHEEHFIGTSVIVGLSREFVSRKQDALVSMLFTLICHRQTFPKSLWNYKRDLIREKSIAS
jgi:hypothetical protein